MQKIETVESLSCLDFSSETMTILSPEQLSSLEPLVNYYFSDADKLHEFRRSESMKSQTFENKANMRECLNDPQVQKIIIYDKDHTISGLFLITHNPGILNKYTPTHLYNVQSGDQLPFLQGDDELPGHYTLLQNFNSSEINHHNKLLKQQANTLGVDVPPITQIDQYQQERVRQTLDSNGVWTLIDSIITEPQHAKPIQQAMLQALKIANHFSPGVLLHHFTSVNEDKFPTSNAHLPILDIIDNQAYWAVKLSPPDHNITPESSAAIDTSDANHRITMRHIVQENLDQDEKYRLYQELCKTEHEACIPLAHKKNVELKHLRHRPYTHAAIIDQELPPETWHYILDSNSKDIGLFIFEETSEFTQSRVRGYFAIATPPGSQMPQTQELAISQNPNVTPKDGSPYIKIIGLVSDKQAQKYISATNYSKWSHLVYQDYLPNGGWIYGDTDANLLNLRLVLLLSMRDTFTKWGSIPLPRKLTVIGRNLEFITHAIWHKLTSRSHVKIQMQQYALTGF